MVETTHTAGRWPSLYEPFRHLGTRLAEWVTPASDASTDKDAYHITLELPGVAEEDIALTAHDGVLRVTGEKKVEREEKGETWYFQERQFGSFQRSFRLPPDAEAREISAALKDGVLTVTIPKLAQTPSEATKIPVTKA
ncbi:Hsp20 family protein [Epibacterium sp. SM1979]|uniref:Hsp20 family protein n=1 Tax=Tritonibacter litoralis TaxID=2662264 RepID=A0A843YEM9_9RHOB|nr:Hsp20/alpha crystallin family protein [Tritonibacter litoralis]MQQ09870.1 Hsp20 family protein [Tritonibacter litoralis]